MEEKIIHNNYASLYVERMFRYAGKGLFLGLISLYFFGKFRSGAILGMGIGAGYCHKDLSNVLKFSFKQ